MFDWLRRLRFVVLILVIGVYGWYFLTRGQIFEQKDIVYGLTFSQKQAKILGLDWQKVFLSTLDDLGVKKLRLSAYWDEVEPKNGDYNWYDLDWMLEEAEKRQVEVILAVGGRLPRWPECHFPGWVKELPKDGRETETLDYITQVVKRYKGQKSIKAWQIENEPFLSQFGECPKLDTKFLDSEIALAKQLDNRPIVVTDSGELSLWVPAARRADIFGTTMYRDTYSKYFSRYVHYPITPSFFLIKKNLADIFASPSNWIVIEQQAEPWSKEAYQNVSQEERDKTMSPQKFLEMLEFARLAGFKEHYLWGVEWWYWEREKEGRSFFWDEARRIFKK